MAQSAVHRCLNIAEVLRNIILMEDTLRTAAILSRTSTTFYDVAQGVVWKDLYDLQPLLWCFPEEVWDAKQEVFKRPPAPQEWSRFSANAKRVKVLRLSSSQCLTDSTCTVLSLYSPMKPLLPNLHHLLWQDEHINDTVFCCSLLFLGPKLRILEYRLQDPLRRPPPERTISVLNAVRHMCPKLEYLAFQNDTQYLPQKLTDIVDELLCALKLKVCKINVPPSPLTVQHLVRSTSLTTMVIFLNPVTLFYLNDTCGFPAARSIHLCLDMEDDPSPVIVYNVRSQNLEELLFSFQGNRWPAAAVVYQLFAGVARLPDPLQMRIFELNHQPGKNLHQEQPLPDLPECVINAGVLQPLFCMQHLTRLRIQHAYLNVTNGLVRQIVKHLPALESLYLLPGYYCDQEPKTTLENLAVVATGLVRLRELGLRFRIASSLERMVLMPRIPRNRTCAKIEVGDSPLADEHADQTAVYISALFANHDLKLVADIEAPGAHAAQTRRAAYCAAWKKCEGFLSALCVARDQEQMWNEGKTLPLAVPGPARFSFSGDEVLPAVF